MHRHALATRELELHDRPDSEVMLLRVVAVGEEAIHSEPAGNAVVAGGPVHADSGVEVGRDAGEVVIGPEEVRRAGADRRYVAYAGLTDERLARGDVDRGEGVRRGDGVVGDEELVH